MLYADWHVQSINIILVMWLLLAIKVIIIWWKSDKNILAPLLIDYKIFIFDTVSFKSHDKGSHACFMVEHHTMHIADCLKPIMLQSCL